MIVFPVLRGLPKIDRVPATYIFFVVNIFVFLLASADYNSSQKRMDAYLDSDGFLQTQGKVFSSFARHHEQQFPPLVVGLADRALQGDSDTQKLMGSLALRSPAFASGVSSFHPDGDDVEVQNWRKDYKEILSIQMSHPSYQMGLSRGHEGPINWITYQFAHSGIKHLFWNMLFLLLFGLFLESLVGTGWLVLLYLSSGVVGAFVFDMMSGFSASPLVGASAAISGLVGGVLAICWGHKVRFFYWLLPSRGYFGIVWLPAWVLLIVYVLPDLTGILSSVPDLNSVAYYAHVGGTLWGVVFGILIRRRVLIASPVDSVAKRYI